MKKVPIIIDCDPGVDDALALITSLKTKQFDIKLITTVAGNVNINLNTKNALFLVENFNPKVPVAKGADKPLVKPYEDCSEVHGKNGLGDFFVGTVDLKPAFKDAQTAYKEVLSKCDKPVNLITLGPLTNIATLIKTQPELLSKIKRVYSMCGSYDGTGNITPYAEYNVYCDPEAFEIFIKSGLEIYFLPMQLGHIAKIEKAMFLNYPVTRPTENMIKKMVRGTVESALPNEYFAIYDLHGPAAIKHPNLYKFVKCDCAVDTNSKRKTYGQVFMNLNDEGKHKVAIIKNAKRTEKVIFNALYFGLDQHR